MTHTKKSCYRAECETPRTADSRQIGERRQDNFPQLVELETIGTRLVRAFLEKYGKDDKALIAQKLGYKTAKAIYKVISGERELRFAQLVRFKNSTNRSIDWLLTGEDANDAPGISPASFSTNERLFIEMLAAHRGLLFEDVVKELVGIGLDERARTLAGNYKKMSEDELRDMLDAVLANDDPDANDKPAMNKKRR